VDPEPRTRRVLHRFVPCLFVLLGVAFVVVIAVQRTASSDRDRLSQGLREANADLRSVTVERRSAGAHVEAFVASVRELGNCAIAFRVASDDSGDAPSEIYVVNADGTAQRNLTRTPRLYEWSPVWSPDGQKLAFSATRTYSPASQIFVINADGSGLKQLTRESTESDFSYMGTWSPDGRQIKYWRTVPDSDETVPWVMSANGGEKRRLEGPEALGSPSPDGQWFIGIRNSGVKAGFYGNPDLFLSNVDGSHGRWLTHTGDIAEYEWSPDGRKILYKRFSARAAGIT
jgi:Tol biopolymer transport system component